jgi:hypothetical protein
MAPLKKKGAKKRKAPRKMPKKMIAPVYGTGMNRDIPMGGAGGSQNLMANLLASRPAVLPPQPAIQTPDQFKISENLKGIREEQQRVAEVVSRSKVAAEESRKRADENKQMREQAKQEMKRPAANLSKLPKEVKAMTEADYNQLASGGAAIPMPTSAGGTKLEYVNKVFQKPRVYVGSLATPPETIIRMEDAGQMETPGAVGMRNSPPFNVVPNPMRQPLAPPPERLRMAAADFSHSLLGREGGGSYDDDDDAYFRQVNGLM